MPTRIDTWRSYDIWLRIHILPKWGDCLLSDVQARPVELWLDTLALVPKSKAHIRGLLSVLWDYAQWRGDIPAQRNPMQLVTVKGATKRLRQPRSLTVEEFNGFARHLQEPFRTLALLCVCFGLRISECLGLKWSDVDWLNSKLRVERGIVCQNVDDVKTAESQKQLMIDRELWLYSRRGSKRPSSQKMRIGYSQALCNSVGCHGRMTKYGGCSRRRQRRRVSADWELTLSGIRSVLGLTRWAPLLRFNRSSCAMPTSERQ
jgi:integrase